MAAASSTSPERTYRYLRLGVVATVVVIFVAVLVAAGRVGWLTALSDYYYTPARNAFVGALIAVSLALLVLSGRGVDRALLDGAAVFGPLIALVPTTVVPGTIPGVDVACASRCLPPEAIEAAADGVITYLIVGALVVLTALILIVRGQVPAAGVRVSLIGSAGVLVVVAVCWLAARDAFLAQGHFVATVVFFALFALVAIRNSFPSRLSPPRRRYRVAYSLIAGLLLLVLVVYVVSAVGAGDAAAPSLLFAESAALALFSAFWLVQTVEKWRQSDPAVLPARS
ncbi:hypothetical protein ABC304_02955 [Microbacterium sp. 1P10UB]|uniref:hypothetical protein n=1 Tax=unclassified Microbacterium TaxID=2609290 RepID=UPI00399F1DD2